MRQELSLREMFASYHAPLAVFATFLFLLHDSPSSPERGKKERESEYTKTQRSILLDIILLLFLGDCFECFSICLFHFLSVNEVTLDMRQRAVYVQDAMLNHESYCASIREDIVTQYPLAQAGSQNIEWFSSIARSCFLAPHRSVRLPKAKVCVRSFPPFFLPKKRRLEGGRYREA